jgi:hypothetical protein
VGELLACQKAGRARDLEPQAKVMAVGVNQVMREVAYIRSGDRKVTQIVGLRGGDGTSARSARGRYGR